MPQSRNCLRVNPGFSPPSSHGGATPASSPRRPRPRPRPRPEAEANPAALSAPCARVASPKTVQMTDMIIMRLLMSSRMS